MAAKGSPLDLSDEELDAAADLSRERDLPSAREWNDRYMPEPYDRLNYAEPDPNDPASPEEPEEANE